MLLFAQFWKVFNLLRKENRNKDEINKKSVSSVRATMIYEWSYSMGQTEVWRGLQNL